MTGAINDFTEDAGRSISEFDVKANNNSANVDLEHNLKKLKAFACKSPDAITLIAEMAR